MQEDIEYAFATALELRGYGLIAQQGATQAGGKRHARAGPDQQRL